MHPTFDFDDYVLAALRAGASGFLLRDAPPEQLVSAIQVVMRCCRRRLPGHSSMRSADDRLPSRHTTQASPRSLAS